MFKGKECWKAEKMTILRGIYKEDLKITLEKYALSY